MALKEEIFGSLRTAQEIWGGCFEGEWAYGWNQKSIGRKLCMPGGQSYWVKVQPFDSLKEADSSLQRERKANKIHGVSKPRLKKWKKVEKEKGCLLFLLHSYIADPVCSCTPDLKNNLSLNVFWLWKLYSQLQCLSYQPAPFLSCRQDLINRRLQERLGLQISTQIQHWATIHGDLHWANLTLEKGYILDWEGWGVGPKFNDLCNLYCASLLCLPVLDLLWSQFEDIYKSQDGKICLLFNCFELMRVHELHGTYPDLYLKLQEFEKEIISSF